MVECPACQTSNPPGTLHCVKCHTPVDLAGATIAFDPTRDAQAAAAGPTGWSVPMQTLGPTDPATALSAGAVLGERYEILRALGEGGMGAVYQARDQRGGGGRQ